MTSCSEIRELAIQHGVGLNGYLPEGDASSQGPSTTFEFGQDNIVTQVDLCRSWIGKFVRRRTINRSLTTDYLLLRVTRETGTTISKGAFILACILEKVELKRIGPTDPDAYTNLSVKIIPGHSHGAPK